MASNSPSPFILLTFSAHHLRGSLDLFASNKPLSLVIAELFLTVSATTFSLKTKLYEERQALGMIDYHNFEREGLFETGLETLDLTGECFVMSRVVLFIYFKHSSRDHIKFNLPVS